MDWLEAVRTAVDFMETHLLEDISAEDAARTVYLSPFHFQRGFRALSGYSVGEYIRGRRLYLAALELIRGDTQVTDVAYKYGYETPESFSKAFRRFHGMTPAEVKRRGHIPRPFLPLKITLTVQGGTNMDVRYETIQTFKVAGISRRFKNEGAYRAIPAWYDELREQGVLDTLGEFAVCVDDNGTEDFAYWVAKPYIGGTLPEGQEVMELPTATWAIFTATGPLPGARQTVNTPIFSEWLPGNPEWEMDGSFSIEHYLPGDTAAVNYKSEIWVPVKKKA